MGKLRNLIVGGLLTAFAVSGCAASQTKITTLEGGKFTVPLKKKNLVFHYDGENCYWSSLKPKNVKMRGLNGKLINVKSSLYIRDKGCDNHIDEVFLYCSSEQKGFTQSGNYKIEAYRWFNSNAWAVTTYDGERFLDSALTSDFPNWDKKCKRLMKRYKLYQLIEEHKNK